jgi:Domain of unknown function (DUF5666)
MKHAVSWAVLVIVAISGSAALGATPPTMSTMGTISAIAGNVITVMTPSGGQVQVRTSTDTRMIGGRAAKPDDIAAGDRVRIVAAKAADGSLTASTVVIAPAQGLAPRDGQRPAGNRPQGDASRTFAAGTVVTSVNGPQGRTVTVKQQDNTTVSAVVPSNARVRRLVSVALTDLKPGMRVRAVGSSNPDGSLTAVGLMVIPQ